MERKPLTPELVAGMAGLLGWSFDANRTRRALAAVEPALAALARNAEAIRFEHEPASHLAALERHRQP
jgi:hypothetical protein